MEGRPLMTIEQLVQQLVQSNAEFARSRSVIIDVDIESASHATVRMDMLLDVLTNILVHAIDSSPTGSRVSICTIQTSSGVEIEIADSSDFTSESARSSSFVVAKSERDLRRMGNQFSVLNCPQGGVAYSISIPKSVRAAA
jgi:K+-sensing histidine kinase KdpD